MGKANESAKRQTGGNASELEISGKSSQITPQKLVRELKIKSEI
jgi:hypothetical protein